MADTNLETMMKQILAQQERIAEDQRQTAARLLRQEQRLAAQASLPDREHVDSAVKRAEKKKTVAQPSHADRILKVIRRGPLTTAQIMAELKYAESDKTAMWAGIAKLELAGDAVVVQRPATNGARGKRGPSVVYHSSHIQLLKPLP